MQIKQLGFVFIGLLLISLILFLFRSNMVFAALKEGQKFDDWTVGCIKDNNKKTVCFLSQQVNITQDEKQQVLALYRIGYFQNKKLSMEQILPLGVALNAGTTIVGENKLMANGKYVTCTAVGCHAMAEINQEELQEILSNEKVNIGFMNAEGKLVHLPFSAKGLREGLEVLNKQ